MGILKTPIKHRTVSGLNVNVVVNNTIPIRSPQKCSPTCSLNVQTRFWGSEGSSVLSFPLRMTVRREPERGRGLGPAPCPWPWGSGYLLSDLSPSLLRWIRSSLSPSPPFLSWVEGASLISPNCDPWLLCVPGEATTWAPESDSATNSLSQQNFSRLWALTPPARTIQARQGRGPPGCRVVAMVVADGWHIITQPFCSSLFHPVQFIFFPVPSETSNQSQLYLGFPMECLFKNLDPLHANKVELRLIVTRVVGFSENCNCEFVTGRDR